jgi:geranylgeranyl pyrophosphate synthase
MDLKGFCEDLDEGKYSFPLIHALKTEPRNLQLAGILQERRDKSGLTRPMKECVLQNLNRAGSMEYTHKFLEELKKMIDDEIEQVEKTTDSPNWLLRLLVRKLHI